jgi:radical SAM protein with 4Fe4S-binding SPASM domain
MAGGIDSATIFQTHCRPCDQSRRRTRSASSFPEASISQPLARIATMQTSIQRSPRRGDRTGSADRIATPAPSTATAANSLFESTQEAERQAIEAAQEIARPLGVTLDASGATEPGLSLKRRDDRAWAACRRPWSLMYFTAHGRALPCCIAPFSVRGYSNYTLGDATQQELREIWNSPAYRDFRTSLLSDTPPAPCQNCGMRWSL